MNAARRKQIALIVQRLKDIETNFENLRDDIEALRDEEQDAFDNLPESLQREDMQTNIDLLDEAYSMMDITIDDVTAALEAIP